jgi:hypothetical protein
MVSVAYPGGITALAQDSLDYPRLNRELHDSEVAYEQMGEENSRLSNRIALKDTILSDLIAGRRTFVEAVRDFHELNQSDPRLMQLLRDGSPGCSDEQVIALNVLTYLEHRLYLDRTGMYAKFVAEYRLHYSNRTSAGS